MSALNEPHKTNKKCSVCQVRGMVDVKNCLTLDFGIVLGNNVHKDKQRPGYLSGNYYVGAVFTPLAEFEIMVYCCDNCYMKFENRNLTNDQAAIKSKKSEMKSFLIALIISLIWISIFIIYVNIFNPPAAFLMALFGFILPALSILISSGGLFSAIGELKKLKKTKENEKEQNNLGFREFLSRSSDVCDVIQRISDNIDVTKYRFRGTSFEPDKFKNILFLLINDVWKARYLYTFNGRKWYGAYDSLKGFNCYGNTGTFKLKFPRGYDVSDGNILHPGEVPIEIEDEIDLSGCH